MLIKFNKKQLTAAIIIIAAVFVSLASFYLINTGAKPEETVVQNVIDQPGAENTDCPGCVRRAIDGVYVANQQPMVPIAVMIENHPDARPQSGLAKANLVFEAEAEGGITRFLAIFADGQKLDSIGPIRSARPYYVDWAKEFFSLYVHCGGSPAALVKITKDKVFNINEFYQGGYFWRSRKAAPHNVYSSTENLNKYIAAKSVEPTEFRSWQYKKDAAEAERGIGGEIEIKFSFPGFRVNWIYDKEKNDYLRQMGGATHKDADGSEVRAKNIVIAYMSAQVLDDQLRLEMDNVGEGKAVVCRDGRCEEGNWRKKSEIDRMLFYNDGDKEFEFNAGTTWIEVVRPEIKINY